MAGIRIGTKFFGTVDELGSENIQTEFFMIVLPLIPLGSYYCLEQGFREFKGFPIALSRKSILVTYLFWWACFPLMFGGIMQTFIQEDKRWLILTVLGIIMAFVTNRMSRLDKFEKRRRTIFSNITGISAPPELLPKEMSQKILFNLEKQWQINALSSSETDWRNIISFENISLESLLLLYCLASYGDRPYLASLLWKEIELN